MVESENHLKIHQLMVVVRQPIKLKGELWDAQSASLLEILVMKKNTQQDCRETQENPFN